MGFALGVRFRIEALAASINALVIYCVYIQFLPQQSKRRIRTEATPTHIMDSQLLCLHRGRRAAGPSERA